MANRNRTNPVQFYLSDDEQYILTTKFKASGMKSMSAFLRKACTWAGRDNYNYHKGMKGIIQELKCLLKTKSISLLDQFNLLHINDSIP